MDNDDIEQIARILDGSPEDFRPLVDRHKHQLYRHCFYIVRDEDAAEDMAQETFITAYHKLGSYNPTKGSFKTWLFTIATRKCLDHLRRRRTLPLEDALTLPSSLPSPLQKAEDHELWVAVGQLKSNYQTVISLYYGQGYSYEEISQVMQAPTSSIRSWLHRAKKQLKEVLS